MISYLSHFIHSLKHLEYWVAKKSISYVVICYRCLQDDNSVATNHRQESQNSPLFFSLKLAFEEQEDTPNNIH